MSNVYQGLNSEATGDRVTKGKKNEKAVADCLNKHYGFSLQDSSNSDDLYKKQDFFSVDGDKKVVYQVKSRASGADILYDLWEPYFGFENENTKFGRDHRGEYDYYVCLNKEGDAIRIVDAVRMRKIVAELMEEFKKAGATLPFYSKDHPGCQFRWHKDRWSGVPKVLCFLRSTTFEENKGEIRFFPMLWD